MMRAPNRDRVRVGPLASTDEYGPNGAFQIRSPVRDGTLIQHLAVIAADGERTGWEHVSVHGYVGNGRQQYTPTWAEMCYVKSLFWDPEDVVVQFHPRESEYVNLHLHVLHLWRYVHGDFPTPPRVLV